MAIAKPVTNYITFQMFCDEVYDRHVDGMITSEVAKKYDLSVSTAYRWLKCIASGKAAHYPGEFDTEMNGVEIHERDVFFTCNGGDEGDTKGECYWFCN